MRDLVIGDLHGYYNGLMKALDRANYDPQSDRLIHVGDIVDGFLNSIDIFDFFIKTEHKILIRGNHDFYAKKYFNSPTYFTKDYWSRLGGVTTLKELREKRILPDTEKFEAYKALLNSQINYHVNDENQLFVHGGIAHLSTVEDVPDESIFYLDRTMWRSAYSNTETEEFKNDYSKIFIGHTALFNLVSRKPPSPDASPLLRRNIWNLDTGAGWGGKVTVMDAATNEYWQSNFAPYSAR